MIADAFDFVPDLIHARQRTGLLLVGLDFDGTLAPIVPVPDEAALPDATRPLLHALAGRSDTRVAIVSGRGLDDLRTRIDAPGLFFAGNHGLEIDGPGVRRVHDDAQAARPGLARAVAELHTALHGVPGVIVEDKGLTASVHFRMVDDADTAERIRQHVHETCARHPNLRATDGKKVVEIRPDVDWNKGRAFEFLRQVVGSGATAAPALFIGDDRTDEDAFRVVGRDGWSIVVGDPPGHDSIARGRLASTDAVADFLRQLLRSSVD